MAEDPAERALRKRRLLAEVEELEASVAAKRKRNEEYAFEVAEKNQAAFQRIFKDDMFDDRDRLMFKDYLMNSLYSSTGSAVKAITGEMQPAREEITIDEVIKNCGYKPDTSTRCAIGVQVKNAFMEKYGKAPEKCNRWVDGAQRKVNCYLKKDEPLLQEVVRKYFATKRGEGSSRVRFGAMDSEDEASSDSY